MKRIQKATVAALLSLATIGTPIASADDYTTMLIDPNVVFDTVSYTAGPVTTNPGGQPGAAKVYSHQPSRQNQPGPQPSAPVQPAQLSAMMIGTGVTGFGGELVLLSTEAACAPCAPSSAPAAIPADAIVMASFLIGDLPSIRPPTRMRTLRPRWCDRDTMWIMTSVRFAAADAQLLWLSAKVPNDQFLVYVFDGKLDIPSALAEVRRNAQECADLRLRVCDDTFWRYPRWVSGDVGDEQFVVHANVGEWRDCLPVLAGLDQLDTRRMAWRVNVFPPNTVVVQIVHALADGGRSAALAATMFGRRVTLHTVRPDSGNLLWRAARAARAHRRLVRDTEAGLLPPPMPPRPALSVNARSSATPVLRTLVVDRRQLDGPTVTVAALSAIAETLGGYLAGRGEDVSQLCAEVPMAGRGNQARNDFRNVTIGLHPELGRAQRTAAISADIDAARRRAEHPAALASAEAFATVPAPLLRWGIGHFDANARSATVNGHTVVSSVNRGPADLTFGGRPVVLTAGFPALSPVMGLTHGVHGIGDRVALSVHADPGVIDVDDYLARLHAHTAVWQGKCE